MGVTEIAEKLRRKLWFEWSSSIGLELDKTYQAPSTVKNIPRRSLKENIVIGKGKNLERELPVQMLFASQSEHLVRRWLFISSSQISSLKGPKKGPKKCPRMSRAVKFVHSPEVITSLAMQRVWKPGLSGLPRRCRIHRGEWCRGSSLTYI